MDLSGTPVWVAGVPLEEDTAWIVTYTGGKVAAFRLDGASGEVGPWLTVPNRLPPGAPPLVVAEEDRLDLAMLDSSSSLTHPVPTEDGLLGVTPDGSLLSETGEEPAVSALADARIVESEDGSLAVLSDPTTRYIHGVLGDAFGAKSIAVVEDGREGYTVSGRIEPESGGSFESLAPLWFRPRRGEEELLAVTEGTEMMGSRISVYSPDGSLVAAGPFVGEPQRWRHLIATGPFGPDGEGEIAAVRTPHVGGPVEFYRLNREEGTLELAASGGKTSLTPTTAATSTPLEPATSTATAAGNYYFLPPRTPLSKPFATRGAASSQPGDCRSAGTSRPTWPRPPTRKAASSSPQARWRGS